MTPSGVRPYAPLIVRLIDASRLPPALAGLAVFVGMQLIFVAWMNAIGELDGATYRGASVFRFRLLWFETLSAGMVALGALALRAAPIAAARRLAELGPTLADPPPRLASSRSIVRGMGLFGIGLGLAFGLWSAHAARLHAAAWPTGVLAWVLLRNAIVIGVIGQSVGLDLHLARAFARLGRLAAHVDLFHPAQRAPFGRQALGGALQWVALASLNAFFLFDDLVRTWTLTFLAILLATAATSLWLPISGIRARVREEKRIEAARVRAEISRARAEAGDALPRVATLVGYLQHVESAREWPFDAPGLLRLGVYLALPIGSWLGGALVERALGWLLG